METELPGINTIIIKMPLHEEGEFDEWTEKDIEGNSLYYVHMQGMTQQ